MRQEFPKRIKLAAFDRSKGKCECCKARLFPGNIEFDHDNPDGLTGEPILENCKVLCSACHRGKTRRDVMIIAKAKRVQAGHIGANQKRGFRQWRRFDGSIVTRDDR